jgi:hypothetical protein
MLREFIEWTGWTMGETYMVLGVPLILGGGALIAWLVGRFSKKWSNRIGGFVLLSLIAWMLMAAMLWEEPMYVCAVCAPLVTA